VVNTLGLVRGIRRGHVGIGHTCTMNVWFGQNVADENELRLCGDPAGKRVIELGVPRRGPVTANSVTLALAGAKVIAVDSEAFVLNDIRAQAERAEVRVQCEQGELADLGFATSASVDVVLAVNTLHRVDDLPRLLRQVHRVLKPGASFVVSMPHPIAAMLAVNPSDVTADVSSVDAPSAVRRPYGHDGWTFAELYLSFMRSDFNIDMIHELRDLRRRDALAPAQLVVRARKLGV
jgi:SAM-dependent methyltransferase